MAEIKRTQAELDEIFRKMKQDYLKLNKRHQEFAIREIGKIRGEIAEFLVEYADEDGKISRRRASMIARDLEDIEKSLREKGEKAFNDVINDSSEWTTRQISKAVGITLNTSQFDRINKQVLKYVTGRFGDDDLVLSDRVWGLSAEVRDELSSVVRREIIKGEGINAMVSKIRKVYNNETWKIRRLARTESVTAHRAATSYNAKESEIVDWVQLIPGENRSEGCVSLAEADPYGKGPGIYKPTDTEIWMPHPNCTSYIKYVLD